MTSVGVRLVLAGSFVVMAGCAGSSHQAARPKPAPPASAYSQSQVLDWVTTTLGNGASLVVSQPAGSTDAQLLVPAQQLAVACSVSSHELTQTAWTGNSHRDEVTLDQTLSRIEALVAAHPAGFGPQLGSSLQTMNSDLDALHKDLSSRSGSSRPGTR